jgi:hypothetical protein
MVQAHGAHRNTMNKKKLIQMSVPVWSIFFCLSAVAKNIVDVYGATANESKKIIKKYGKAVADLEQELQEIFKSASGDKVNSKINNLALKKKTLTEKIKNESNFLYVDFNTVFYSGDKNQYTTIEIIRKNQRSRLKFISSMTQENSFQPKDDLINQMIIFENIETKLMLNNQLDTKKIFCPVYHCTSGFQHPELKPYLEIFNQGAEKEKQLLIDTMNHDVNPQRRAAAAFLTAHLNDPQEIIHLLLSHVKDKDNGVRNNVIRVIASTMAKANIKTIDLKPFMVLLNSPVETDRNKALWILLVAADSPTARKILRQNVGPQLLSLLALKQPNNHELAYLILKKISGKDLGEYNVPGWQNWLVSLEKKMESNNLANKEIRKQAN